MDQPLTAPAVLDERVCDRARLARDPRFDGLFFIGVRSTGIYCRPICPARSPKRENIRYYASAAAATAAGLRPCLRCRPEAAPGSPQWDRGGSLVARALRRIDEGFLDRAALPELARSLAISPRQLRRLFVERLGVSAIDVDITRRALFAKKLLSETSMPVTTIAHASGYRSLRRFNAAFRATYGKAPRELRRRASGDLGAPLSLTLTYRPPYDASALLAFLARRAIPGVESVTENSYLRRFSLRGTVGWLRVSVVRGQHALNLQVHLDRPAELATVVARVRRLFDLDADPATIAAQLGRHPALRTALREHPGQRVPGCWDGFELAVRAILGQQISVAAARTLASRLAQRFGTAIAAHDDTDRLFPDAATLADADLQGIGLTRQRAATLRGLARAVADRQLDFDPGQDPATFMEACCALSGIGPWTANYIAMRALHYPDAFPAADLILRQVAGTKQAPLSTAQLETLSQDWRPWRSYAVMHLWRMAV